MGRSMPKPISYLPPSLNREEKLLLHLEVAMRIVYLVILIVIFIYALRKRKTNSSSGGQTSLSVNVASDGGDTSSTQITVDPTCLALEMTTAFS
ncbi:isoform 2 of elongation factor 1-gamma 2 [Fagus crenata]